jgi:ABC-2 type transport system permease protein
MKRRETEMIIFVRELRKNLKYFIIWTSLMVLMTAYMGFLFPTMSSQSKTFQKLMEGYPKALIEAFNLDLMDFTNIVKFFASESYVFLILLGSIFAMILSAGMLSKEENDKTIEFLYAKPVTRNYIITSKLLSVLFYILSFNVIIGVSTIGIFLSVSKTSFSIPNVLLLLVGATLVQLVFAAIGFVISVFIVKTKTILPITISIVIGAYFINSLAGMSSNTEKFKYITPFKYVDARDILKNNSINGVYLAIMAAVVIISIILSYVIYNRKNITV